MVLRQAAYCRCVLEQFAMNNTKLAPTVMSDNVDKLYEEMISSEVMQESCRELQYRELPRSVLKLSNHTQPDTIIAVNL